MVALFFLDVGLFEELEGLVEARPPCVIDEMGSLRWGYEPDNDRGIQVAC